MMSEQTPTKGAEDLLKSAGFLAHGETQLTTGHDGDIFVEIPPLSGHYGVWSEPVATWAPLHGSEAILSVEVECLVDSVGLALVSNDGHFLSGERKVRVSDGPTTCQFFIDESLASGRLLVRNYATGSSAPRARIFGLRIETSSELDAVTLKSLRAAEFSDWYYSIDLGDGVISQAGLSAIGIDPMPAHRRGSDILQYLLEHHWGGVRNKSVFDIGCSGGFHSLTLARAGAKVLGMDPDEVAIRQARFAAECISDTLAFKPQFEVGSIYAFSHADLPVDISFCSGLLYHLSDIPAAVRQVFEWCKEGAVFQTSISDLPGQLLEFANADKYEFSVPRGEFAFVPTREVLPLILGWAGFRESYVYDISQFITKDGKVTDVRRELEPTSKGPVYIAALK